MGQILAEWMAHRSLDQACPHAGVTRLPSATTCGSCRRHCAPKRIYGAQAHVNVLIRDQGGIAVGLVVVCTHHLAWHILAHRTSRTMGLRLREKLRALGVSKHMHAQGCTNPAIRCKGQSQQILLLEPTTCRPGGPAELYGRFHYGVSEPSS